MQYILDFDIELNVWLLKKGIYHQNGFGVFPTKNAIDAMLEIRNLLFIFLIIYNLELKFGSNKNRQENKNKLKNDENFPHSYLYNFEFFYSRFPHSQYHIRVGISKCLYLFFYICIILTTGKCRISKKYYKLGSNPSQKNRNNTTFVLLDRSGRDFGRKTWV